jgi:hypothetical protein
MEERYTLAEQAVADAQAAAEGVSVREWYPVAASTPDPELGDIGDMAVTPNGDVWQKGSEGWATTGLNIIGPQGVAGATGPQGDTGPAGPQGDPGPAGSDAEVTAGNIAAALGAAPYTANTPRIYFPSEFDNGNSGTAKTIDWAEGQKQKITLTDNVTLTFSDPGGPAHYHLKLIQDATGNRAVTWPAGSKFFGGTAPAISTAAASVSLVSIYYDGAAYWIAGGGYA